MTRLVADLPLPADWHELDLDPVTGPAALDDLVAALAAVLPALAEPAAAGAAREHYAGLAAQQRDRGVLVSAFLLGRDDDGVLAAALEVVTVPLGEAGTQPGVAADGLALVLGRAVSPDRSVARLDLPAGPAVGLRDVLDDPDAGPSGVVQVWLPLEAGSALVLALSTPCLGELDGFTRLLATLAHGLVLEPSVTGCAQGPMERQSRARSAAT